MSAFTPVAWREGLFLLPVHLQQQERALVRAAELRCGPDLSTGWGLASLTLDEAALSRGRIEVRRCRAILPDGAPVDVPEVDAAPLGRAVEIPPGSARVEVLLALPVARAGAPVLSADPTRGDARYVERQVEVADDLSPDRRHTIGIAAKNLRLLFGGEATDGLVTLKLCELRRGEDRALTVDEAFIPPCVCLGASPALGRLVDGLVGRLASRAASLADLNRGGQGDGGAASGPAALLFLHTLSQQLGVLRHLAAARGTHPATLFMELLRLAGGLSPFQAQEAPPLPAYRHEAPHAPFHELVQRVEGLLGKLFVTTTVTVPLVKRDGFWQGILPRGEPGRDGRFTLEVRGEVDHGEVVARLPRVMKLGSPDRVQWLVQAAVAGVEISALRRPPAGVPVDGAASYFEIQTDAEEWRKVVEQGQVAAFVPSWMPGLSLRIFATPGGGA